MHILGNLMLIEIRAKSGGLGGYMRVLKEGKLLFKGWIKIRVIPFSLILIRLNLILR
jgi:hypothetical protein